MLVMEPKGQNPTTPSPEAQIDRDLAAHAAQEAEFAHRHIGPNQAETNQMLELIGCHSLDELNDKTVPPSIRLDRPLSLPAAQNEHATLAALREIACQNKVFKSYIGMGYYQTILPAVIQRNIIENPGWYTQYTPYQAEISQGRLEALLTFQTMVMDLTAMEVANASLLDEGTAAAEAMIMCHGLRQGRNTFFVSESCHPQTIDVMRTRAKALGIQLVVGDYRSFTFTDQVCGALVQYPDTFGVINDYSKFVELAHGANALVAVAADLLSLTLLTPPGEFGADICLGSTQRLGVPLGYGGPHAAYFATRDTLKRAMPGRIVGVSKDSQGRAAFRLSLQTREQHIRREKATSNICTAQALLANVAAIFACYHGAEGLNRIAKRIQYHTRVLAAGLQRLGFSIGQQTEVAPSSLAEQSQFFDTIWIGLGNQNSERISKTAEAHRMNFRVINERAFGISAY